MEWVYRNSLEDLWNDMPQDVIRFPDLPTGIAGSSSYITRILYEGGLYIAKLRQHQPAKVYLAYDGTEISLIWTGSMEVMAMNESRCRWETVDTLMTSSYPGTSAGMLTMHTALSTFKASW